jgi:formylglycine-generating enzyme required for sulfatase activity
MGVSLERAIPLCEASIPDDFRGDVGCDPEALSWDNLSGAMERLLEPTRVSLDAFYIDQYEVSVGAYLDCVDADVCSEESLGLSRLDALQSGDALPPDMPYSPISYANAAVYCAWREARLPTEAEWEYAARSPQGFAFPWGNEFDPTRLNFGDWIYREASSQDWDDGYFRTAPVDAFPEGKSWVGAYNMAGNVGELTSTHPILEDGMPDYRAYITKGGTYLYYAHGNASWVRFYSSEVGAQWEWVGFRCARTDFAN